MGKLNSSPALGTSVSRKAVQKALEGPSGPIADSTSGSADAPTINYILSALRALGLIDDAVPADVIVAGPDTNGTLTNPSFAVYDYIRTAAAAWDGGSHGTVVRSGDFRYKLTVSGLLEMMFGLTTGDPAASSGFADMAHQVYLKNNGTIRKYDASVDGGSLPGTYVAGDVFWVDRTADSVTFKHGPDFDTATLLRTIAMSGDVSLDLTVFTQGVSIEIAPIS